MNKKFWETLIARFLFTVILVSRAVSRKKILVHMRKGKAIPVTGREGP
jgi:hypothetical protein